MSSGWEAGGHVIITVNGQRIDCQPNAKMSTRGIHLVTLDMVTHQVESAQIFDVHKLDMEADKLYDRLNELEFHHMAIMAVSDEGSGKMHHHIREII